MILTDIKIKILKYRYLLDFLLKSALPLAQRNSELWNRNSIKVQQWQHTSDFVSDSTLPMRAIIESDSHKRHQWALPIDGRNIHSDRFIIWCMMSWPMKLGGNSLKSSCSLDNKSYVCFYECLYYSSKKANLVELWSCRPNMRALKFAVASWAKLTQLFAWPALYN